MIANSRMTRLQESATTEPARLPAELTEILAHGWTVAQGGALGLTALTAAAAAADPGRVAWWEIDTNDVHIPDDDLRTDPATYLPRVAARGRTFAAAALRRARGLPGADALVAVVGTGADEDFVEHGTTVKFFTRRGDYPRWFDDLEGFELEAMAVLDAADAL